MECRQHQIFPLGDHSPRQAGKSLRILVLLVCVFMVTGVQLAQAQTAFQHPGVLVSRAQLDFIKQQVANKVDPIYTEFLNAQNSRYGSTSPYTPQGPPSGGVIQCGSFSNPDIGCTAEDEDGTTAYTQALLYWITGNSAHAQNAITILNAYGHNLVSYTDSNGPLQAAWGASKWARAAEIIRYSNAGWSAADAQTFGTMMNNAMLPNIINGSSNNGNWELSMIEGMIGIAVYNNDSNLFNHAVTFWHQRVPAYFYYFPTDGPNPVPPPRGSLNWNGQTVFNNSVNGVAQETCRDFGHTEFGIAATIAAAETAHIQGVDLYGSEKPRLEAALEFHAFYLLGNPVPSSVCNGSVTLASRPTFEIGYNNYHNRLGDSLPNTLQWLIKGIRTQTLEVDHHMIVFETLSHGADAGISQPDFSISASGSQTVTAGNSASFTATVAPINGFTGGVALSVSGLPSGARASFNPSSINGGLGSSTLTVTTSSSTPAGSYTLTITGTSGSIVHTATTTLTVNSPPLADFTLKASPASQTVTVGNSTTYTVTISPANGYAGTVGLSVSGLPTNATANFNPASVSGGSGTSTLTVTAGSSTPTNSFTLTITGSDSIAGLSHSANVTLVVNAVQQCVTASSAWQNTAMAGQTGTFTVIFDATPSASPINAVIGLSANAAAAYTDLATIARFNPAGDIDARNGGSYNASSVIPYSSGVKYHFRMVINIPSHTYSVFVTAPGGVEQIVGSNFAFRTEQNTVSQLSWWGAFASAGSETVCNFMLGGSGGSGDFSLTASPNTLTVTAGTSVNSTVNVGALSGFSGTVALSVNGASGGVNASLTPSSLSGSGSSTLNITTSSTTTPGSYTLTVTGTSGSLTHSVNVSLTVNASAPVCVTTTTNGPWQDTAFTNQTGSFTAEFDATPSASSINAVVGLSNGAAGAYTDLAAIARFNPSGDIDARDGGAYNMTNTIPYTGGVTYHFRMVINIPAHTYSVFVTAPGGVERTLGSNFAFRTEQNTVTQLNWWGAFSGAGSETVCSFAIH